ncbi:MAG: RNA methyltransferase [Bacteroidota bacterium]
MRKSTHEEIAVRRIRKEDAATVKRLPIFVLLDNVRSLYNVGSIFRTADGALIEKLLLTGYTPRPPRKEIEKTALGATETVPWEHFEHSQDAIASARGLGAKICVLEQTTESNPYYNIRKSDFPLCLVVGNEITGISPSIVEAADMAIDIPMYGMKQSLNVAVASGIALFELARIFREK